MANLSSFFPAIGGGGGFTKMNKYVTMRSGLDATHFEGLTDDQLRVHPTQETGSSVSVGSNEVTFYRSSPSTGAALNALHPDKVSLLVGKTFTRRNTDGNSDGQVYTITSVGAHTVNSSYPIQFTPSLTVALPLNHYCDLDLSFGHTVNPANDLGLSDGDQIGYFMVGGGDGEVIRSSTANFGGKGGKIIYGTATISNASTNLVITPGIGADANTSNDGTASTISGGLTLTTADGSQHMGWFSRQQDSNTIFSAGPGIMGYGTGGRNQGGGGSELSHGWGTGAASINSSNVTAGGDGAVLIYY